MQLIADLQIRVDGRIVPLTIRYPDYFPDVPPSVAPTEDIRLSSHQYGKGGELCLEFRADNWVSSVTGAMMIESAYRLLSGESGEAAPPVPSEHRVTLGQQVRSSTVRLALSVDAEAALKSLPEGKVTEAVLRELKLGDTWVASLSRLGATDEPIFSGPAALENATTITATAFRLPEARHVPPTYNEDKLSVVLEECGLGEWLKGVREKGQGAIFLIAESDIKLIQLFSGEKLIVIEYKIVRLPALQARLPEEFVRLGVATVGIVGCGSVGSKVAASLARSGVANFLLLDGDVFLPDNVTRNDLDLRAVAINKTKAVKQRILEINPTAHVSVRTILLGGQESSESTASAMAGLAKCALIVDATANPDVFTLCATIAKAERKPMVWGQVFGGGIGGIVAMARPDVDPPPLLARNQILGWYANLGVRWNLGSAVDYDIDRGDAMPLIASDAEVAIIAAHIAQMAIDRLLARAPSQFLSPVYVLGFKTQWIFSGPFDTFPIQYIQEGAWGPDREANAAEAVMTFINEIYPSKKDED